MTLHVSLPGSQHHRSAEQQQEMREARRLLRDKIKDDWEYPTLPAWKSSGREDVGTQQVQDGIAGFRFHIASNHERTNGVVGEALGLGFEPTQWREREYSDISGTEPEDHSRDAKSAHSSKSTYLFDGPDSVGAQLKERRRARKRKRYQALQEEMEWNDGLAHWQRRRDLWCCARQASEVRMLEGSAASLPDHDNNDNGSASASTSSSPRASTSSVDDAEGASTPESTPATSPEASSGPQSTPTTSATCSPSLEVLIPMAPPLLPNYPLRKRINVNMYPEIYAKIIVQSRTPSIPINLRTLIDALVQGWKDDGEWPPKMGPIEKSIGRKKGSTGHEGSLKQGVKAVGKILRLTNTKAEG